MAKGFAPNQGQHYTDGLIWLGLLVQRSIRQSNVSVGTSAVKLPTTPLSQRKSIIIFNNSANILYLGASDVTTSNGYPVYPRAAIQINIEDSIDIYGVASGASSDIRLFEGA